MPFILDEERSDRSNPPWLIVLIGLATLVILFVLVAFVFAAYRVSETPAQSTATPAPIPTTSPAK